MPYAISEIHNPKTVADMRQKLVDAITALPVGKAITITDEDKQYRDIRNYISQVAAKIKGTDGGHFACKKTGPHSIQVTRLAGSAALSPVGKRVA